MIDFQDSLYIAVATATGGRRGGEVATDDGRLALRLAMPTELGGSGGEGTNPEQLFATGYAGCFHSAVGVAARKAGVTVGAIEVAVSVGIGRNAGGDYDLAAEVAVAIEGTDLDTACAVVTVAHRQLCPYSRAIRNNIRVDVVVNGTRVDIPEGAP